MWAQLPASSPTEGARSFLVSPVGLSCKHVWSEMGLLPSVHLHHLWFEKLMGDGVELDGKATGKTRLQSTGCGPRPEISYQEAAGLH